MTRNVGLVTLALCGALGCSEVTSLVVDLSSAEVASLDALEITVYAGDRSWQFRYDRDTVVGILLPTEIGLRLLESPDRDALVCAVGLQNGLRTVGGCTPANLRTARRTRVDISLRPTTCGDGFIAGSEVCDGADLQGATCEAVGAGTGELRCDPVTCTYDTDLCANPFCPGCELVRIGKPAWQVGGVLLFQAFIGGPGSGYAEGRAVIGTVNGAYHPLDGTFGFWGPGEPHSPPYAGELFALAASHGYVDRDTYASAEFTEPEGIIVGISIVPSTNAPEGSSADAPLGPILPNAMFPLTVTHALRIGGTPVLSEPPFNYPSASEVDPLASEDGYSHFMDFTLFNSSTPPVGSASLELWMSAIDSTGAGWEVSRFFTVGP